QRAGQPPVVPAQQGHGRRHQKHRTTVASSATASTSPTPTAFMGAKPPATNPAKTTPSSLAALASVSGRAALLSSSPVTRLPPPGNPLPQAVTGGELAARPGRVPQRAGDEALHDPRAPGRRDTARQVGAAAHGR